MNSISFLLCLLPLLTSVLALPAAELIDLPLDLNEEHLAHPHQEQLDPVQPHQHQTEKASNGGSVEERATDCALFLCIRWPLKARFTFKTPTNSLIC